MFRQILGISTVVVILLTGASVLLAGTNEPVVCCSESCEGGKLCCAPCGGTAACSGSELCYCMNPSNGECPPCSDGAERPELCLAPLL